MLLLGVTEHLLEVDNQRLDNNGVLAAVPPVNVSAGRSDEVGGPDNGEVAGGHAGGVVVLGEVVEVSQQILHSLQVMVRQLEDGGPEELTVTVDWLTGDIQHPVVLTVGQEWVGKGAEKELNTK